MENMANFYLHIMRFLWLALEDLGLVMVIETAPAIVSRLNGEAECY
jgi:hypothetical protein